MQQGSFDPPGDQHSAMCPRSLARAKAAQAREAAKTQPEGAKQSGGGSKNKRVTLHHFANLCWFK